MTKDNLTSKALQVLALAKKEAQSLKNSSAGTEHLLLGLLDSPSKTIYSLLLKYGVTINDLKSAIYDCIGVGETEIQNFETITFTPRVGKIVTKAIDHAKKLNVEKAEVEHLFYILLSEEGGTAASIFETLGINTKQLLSEFKDFTVSETTEVKEVETEIIKPVKRSHRKKLDAKFLASFGSDLTYLAYEKKLPPVIGREKEMDAVIEILCQKNKNNPMLVGEAGVGKTAIVEGIAQKIILGDVPAKLKEKVIISLDITAMIAGTKYRGQFEERVKGVLADIKATHGNVILFIDEAHQVIGAGSSDKVCDLGNIIKPYLARGELCAIGATTLKEYKATIEKDSALERRFRRIDIFPPSIEESIEILKGVKYQYEEAHKVTYEPTTFTTIVKLSERFVPHAQLPDKAIDLLDAVGTSKRIQCDKNTALVPVVTDKDVHLKMSQQTGIPDYKFEEGDIKILQLDNFLHTNVIGQDKAIEVIVNALKRTHAELRDINRPVGSFLLLGPTGVGKTHICKKLAYHLFGSEDNLIQIDMSEFAEKHTVSSLIGAPPGYIHADQGGRLTELIKRKPYSIVLFDEIEKAHPDAIQLLLQVLEEGKLSDRFGTPYSFKNSIIALTSNIGAEILQQTNITVGFKPTECETKEDAVLEVLRKSFKPEFINRIDEIVIFNKLSKENITNILSLFLKTYVDKLLDVHKIELRFAPETLAYLAQKGFSDRYGAREMRRVLSKEFETPLANFLLLSRERKPNIIIARLEAEKITFEALVQ